MKKGLSHIISENQSGFLGGRSIHTNIRLVLDLIDCSDIFVERGFIIFLDFYKAFDSVEHPFILEALKHFGFGQKFTNLISIIYTNINSCVSLEQICSRFSANRGIRLAAIVGVGGDTGVKPQHRLRHLCTVLHHYFK